MHSTTYCSTSAGTAVFYRGKLGEASKCVGTIVQCLDRSTKIYPLIAQIISTSPAFTSEFLESRPTAFKRNSSLHSSYGRRYTAYATRRQVTQPADEIDHPWCNLYTPAIISRCVRSRFRPLHLYGSGRRSRARQ